MENTSNKKIFFSRNDFLKINDLNVNADMIRYNTIAMIINAQSGHIGASLSCIDILTVLYHRILKPTDYFILSKGHGVAGLYATLESINNINENDLLTFRKIHGLQGHSDMACPSISNVLSQSICSNTGSLGMGISKGKGYALASKENMVYVLIGDGELQEGQNWEAIMSASRMKLDNLVIIVDNNRIQTENHTTDTDNLTKKFESFNCDVIECNGHNIIDLIPILTNIRNKKNRKPKVIIAHTIKGYGIRICEEMKFPYRWHSGILNIEEYKIAATELLNKITIKLKITGIILPEISYPLKIENEFIIPSLKNSFSKWLLHVKDKYPNIVVLDADLKTDCGLNEYQKKYPNDFIEVGIAEQDMVSMAGSLEQAGRIPIVNSYTAFLTSRANEQIFNNASELSQIIYVGHLAGVLPSKAGKSHWGVRDISLLKAIPNFILFSPSSEDELIDGMDYLIGNQHANIYLRLEHCNIRNELPININKISYKKGNIITTGTDIVIIAYGPLMLSECLLAQKKLCSEISIKIINLPWLNKIDSEWLKETIGNINNVLCIENHSIYGGQSDEIRKLLPDKNIHTIGIDWFGQSGDAKDILEYYWLDYKSIATKVKHILKR